MGEAPELYNHKCKEHRGEERSKEKRSQEGCANALSRGGQFLVSFSVIIPSSASKFTAIFSPSSYSLASLHPLGCYLLQRPQNVPHISQPIYALHDLFSGDMNAGYLCHYSNNLHNDNEAA